MEGTSQGDERISIALIIAPLREMTLQGLSLFGKLLFEDLDDLVVGPLLEHAQAIEAGGKHGGNPGGFTRKGFLDRIQAGNRLIFPRLDDFIVRQNIDQCQRFTLSSLGHITSCGHLDILEHQLAHAGLFRKFLRQHLAWGTDLLRQHGGATRRCIFVIDQCHFACY